MENWEKINAVQRMQDYIEQHLRESITLRMLANAAGYSPWHAARMFKEIMGKAPFEYIRALRLSRAAVSLWNEEGRIVDVAFDFVFDSHEGFSRAFTKQFGITPQYYRHNTIPLKLFMPNRIHDYYRIMQRGEGNMEEKAKNKTIFVQVVDRPARKLIVKRGAKAADYFAYCEEVGCEVWGVLCSIKEALYEPIGMWLPENLRTPGTSQYAMGVEVAEDYRGQVPEGFEIISLPPCKMMVFQGQPYDDENFMEEITGFWEDIKDYNPELYGFAWADQAGPRFQLEPLGYRGYIEARPVRQL